MEVKLAGEHERHGRHGKFTGEFFNLPGGKAGLEKLVPNLSDRLVLKVPVSRYGMRSVEFFKINSLKSQLSPDQMRQETNEVQCTARSENRVIPIEKRH